jgi:predicted nucleic acid-binding protein
MKFVLDSNIGVKWVLEEDLSEKARSLREEFVHGAHEFLSPNVFLAEVAHALTRAQRQGRINSSEVEVFMADVLTTLPEFRSYYPLLSRAIEISVRARVGVYDCLYVALAEAEGCELLTADDRLVRALQGDFPFITQLGSMP